MSSNGITPSDSSFPNRLQPIKSEKEQPKQEPHDIDIQDAALESIRSGTNKVHYSPKASSKASGNINPEGTVSRIIEEFESLPSHQIKSSQVLGNKTSSDPAYVSSFMKEYTALPVLPAKEDDTELHALFILTGAKDQKTLQKANGESTAWLDRRQMFIEQVTEANKLTSIQESKVYFIRVTEGDAQAEKAKNAAIAANLQDYVFNQPGGVDRFTTSEQTFLFQNFYDLADFNGLDSMMTSSKNEAFTKNLVNIEFHARLALHNKPPQPYYARMVCQTAITHLLSTLGDLSDTGYVKYGELYALAGEAMKMQIQSTKNYLAELERQESDPNYVIDQHIKEDYLRSMNFADSAETTSSLRDTISQMESKLEKALINAFFLDLEPAHGISLAMKYLEWGKVEDAITILKMTEVSCINRGVFEFPKADYAKSLMIATLAQGKDLGPEQLKQLAYVISQAEKIDGVHETQNTLEALNKLHQAGLIDTAQLSSVEAALKNPVPSPSLPQTGTDKLRKISYNYQGIISNYISGNFRFGGLLYSSHLNRSDNEAFEKLVNTPLVDLIDKTRPHSQERLQQIEAIFGPEWDQKKMIDIEDPLQLMTVLDLFIRQSFYNEELEMEDLHSQGHKTFENATYGLFQAGGMSEREKRKQVDAAGSPIPGSRTNPSAALSLGLGDCRQHAQTKQLLFDSWRRIKINHAMREAYKHRVSGQSEKSEAAFKRAEELSQMDLRTFDVVVKAPIKMVEKYDPLMSSSGEHLATDTLSYEDVEDHTFNMIFMGDKVYFADSFYQDHKFYHWGSGEVDIAQVESEGVIDGGTIEALDAKGVSHDYPIHLVPTSYAGKRDAFQRGSNETFILGIPTEIDIISTMDLHNRQSRFQMIQSLAQ